MKKPYLLIAGWDYYPSRGTGDWVACFETKEEALQFEIKSYYEWKKVVDLREWTGDDDKQPQ